MAIKDVLQAEQIFVKDVGHLKRSTTQKNTKHANIEAITILPKITHQCDNLRLFIDLFFVNSLPMLTTIDSAICNRALVCLANQTKKEIHKGLGVILRSYNKAGYFFKLIRGDNEFRPLLTDLEDDLDIELDFVAQGEHVPKAERNNRTIGERIRAGFHRL